MRRDGLPSPHSIKKIRARETGEWGSFFLSQGKNTPLPKKKERKAMARKVTEKNEIARLKKLYERLPANKFAVAEGLIIQAARYRVMLDNLLKDIEEKGSTEIFSQSDKTEPYARERPAMKLYQSVNKEYLAMIKQLDNMLPAESSGGKLEELMRDG